MKLQKVSKRVISFLLIFVLLLTMLPLQINNNKVYADDETVIDVTGLATGAESSHDCNNYLVTRYNESQHWKECSICGKRFDVYNHSFTTIGRDVCAVNEPNIQKYCDCGYTIVLPKKAHTLNSYWESSEDHACHVKKCAIDDNWVITEPCRDSQGRRLGCATGNSGYCATCGAYIYGDKHGLLSSRATDERIENNKIITTGTLVCDICSKQFATYTMTATNIDNNTTKVHLECISSLNLERYVSVNMAAGDCAGYFAKAGLSAVVTNSNISGNKLTADATLTYIYDSMPPANYEMHFSAGMYKPDTFMPAAWFHCHGYFNPDLTAPTYNNAYVNYLNYVNGYATKATVTASFNENYDKICYIRVLDSDGTTVISDWGAAIRDGNTFTREIDLSTEFLGTKQIYVQAKDTVGNMSSLVPVTVSSLDTKPPVITASGETSKDWTTSKTYVVSATDDGVGNVQIAFNKLNAYATTVRNGNSYSKTYKFVGDVYGDTHAAVYYKDSVGNANMSFITISNIDNTAPTITDTSSESSGDTNDATVTVTANDVNTVLQKSGSGVQQYAISEINSANNLNWQGTNQLKVTKTGDYFVFARDLVGNVSSSRQVHVEVKSKYKVVHKLQNGTDADSTDYSTVDTETFHAPINTMVTPATKTYRGFTAPTKQTVKVKNDGTTVVTYKYKRNHYKVHIDFNKGNLNGDASGTDYILNPDLVYGLGNWCRIGKPYRVGYDFVGYYDHDGLKVYQTINDKDTEAINGTKYWIGSNGGWSYQETSDMYLKAHYTPRNDTKYVINHYLMTVDGKAYALRDTDHKEGTSDKVITVSDYQKHYNGFTYAGGKGTDKASAEKPSQLDIKTTIAADGSRVINLYYTRNKYNLTVKPNGGTYDGKASDSVFNMFYQATKVMNKPSKKDCAFLGWTLSGINESSISNNVFKMGYSDASLTANWSELPKFADVYSNVVYEGQTVTYNDLLKLVKATDKDYENGTKLLSIKVDKIRYCDNSEVTPESDFILDTASNKIGKLYVTYTTVDIKPSLDGITDTSHAETITVTYTRECEIRYNDLPSIKTEPYIYTYTGDKTLTEDTIESFVKGYVTVNDKQDDVDLIPWWKATETKSGLRNSIEVVKVTDIQLDSAYVKDNADFAATVKNINSLKGIYSLKNTAPDAFNAITSYNIVFDVKDQWGKYTSGRLSNYAVGKGVTVSARDKTQTDADRSILVICTKDSSYNNAYEGLRYVSSKYVNTVNVNSYWGDYGKAELNSVLKKRDLVYADENVKPTDTYVGTYKKKNGSSIYIQINDYTE